MNQLTRQSSESKCAMLSLMLFTFSILIQGCGKDGCDERKFVLTEIRHNGITTTAKFYYDSALRIVTEDYRGEDSEGQVIEHFYEGDTMVKSYQRWEHGGDSVTGELIYLYHYGANGLMEHAGAYTVSSSGNEDSLIETFTYDYDLNNNLVGVNGNTRYFYNAKGNVSEKYNEHGVTDHWYFYDEKVNPFYENKIRGAGVLPDVKSLSRNNIIGAITCQDVQPRLPPNPCTDTIPVLYSYNEEGLPVMYRQAVTSQGHYIDSVQLVYEYYY